MSLRAADAATTRVRLYSTKTLKPLGTLDYHKKSCLAVTFARALDAFSQTRSDEDSEDEMTEAEKDARSRWLAAGSQDHRVSIWQLISFEKR